MPTTAPAEWQDRETLWNAVDETAKDSRLAREFVADGMCADASIHAPYPPGHNLHAHIDKAADCTQKQKASNL